MAIPSFIQRWKQFWTVTRVNDDFIFTARLRMAAANEQNWFQRWIRIHGRSGHRMVRRSRFYLSTQT